MIFNFFNVTFTNDFIFLDWLTHKKWICWNWNHVAITKKQQETYFSYDKSKITYTLPNTFVQAFKYMSAIHRLKVPKNCTARNWSLHLIDKPFTTLLVAGSISWKHTGCWSDIGYVYYNLYECLLKVDSGAIIIELFNIGCMFRNVCLEMMYTCTFVEEITLHPYFLCSCRIWYSLKILINNLI